MCILPTTTNNVRWRNLIPLSIKVAMRESTFFFTNCCDISQKNEPCVCRDTAMRTERTARSSKIDELMIQSYQINAVLLQSYCV
jgi:hypothetical protein